MDCGHVNFSINVLIVNDTYTPYVYLYTPYIMHCDFENKHILILYIITI